MIDIQHVVDHAKQQVDRQLHVVPPLSLLGQLRPFVLCEQLQRLLDPHQRITNIVGEHRSKLTQRGEALRTDQLLFETLLFCEVAQLYHDGNQRSGVLDRHQIDFHDERAFSRRGHPHLAGGLFFLGDNDRFQQSAQSGTIFLPK